MIWTLDGVTAEAARLYPLKVLARPTTKPQPQFGGRHFQPESWNSKVKQPAAWPTGSLMSSPESIIDEFRSARYTQGLAMVASWGTMWRNPGAIWGRHTPVTLERVLAECARDIRKTESIEKSWHVLTGSEASKLGWSAVAASKTLHFLCRSIGLEQDPPVAIDNLIIRNQVWPAFRDGIPAGSRPLGWAGNGFDAYWRYMTAILTWARMRGWTTTQVEATIFKNFRA